MFLFLSMALVACYGGQGRTSGGMAPKESRLSAHIKMGLAYLEVGNFNSALAELSQADLLEPNNVDINSYLGLTYFRRGDFPQALERFNKVLSLDPTRTEAHNNLGLTYVRQNDYAQARKEFEICVKDPTYSQTHLAQYNLASLDETEGKLDRAEAIYHQIIKSNQMPAAYYRLGRMALNRGDAKKAVDYLLSAVRLDSKYADAYYTLAQAYEKVGRVDDAAEAYGQVINLTPNSARAMEAQAQARRILGF
jgi:Tfp pilus assembly protein PilF